MLKTPTDYIFRDLDTPSRLAASLFCLALYTPALFVSARPFEKQAKAISRLMKAPKLEQEALESKHEAYYCAN